MKTYFHQSKDKCRFKEEQTLSEISLSKHVETYEFFFPECLL